MKKVLPCLIVLLAESCASAPRVKCEARVKEDIRPLCAGVGSEEQLERLEACARAWGVAAPVACASTPPRE